uniref:5-formyltetrahydrofolate cyclo-ligase n=1 Tax=Anopheles stephensi TaxID=30069 RepID=A0A182Y525_ANOST
MAYSDSDDSNPKIGDERAEKTLESNESIPHTKRTYRLQTWKWVKRLYDKHSGFARYINRKIPLFPDAEKAANLLAETPEFKEASKSSIKVNIDRAQEAVKLHVLKSKKTLFVAPTQKSEYLYAKIKAPENLDEIDLEQVQNQNIVKVLARGDTYEELGIDQAEPLDMIVVGCVAVSERGQRIGKGNGIVDLEIAILHSLGVITPKTVIATTVADEQVYPSFDPVLFQNYDFTVDLIVTPSRVIRVEPRPEQRTIGVQWDLLSARRLEILRVLKPLKKRLEDEGQKIELKEEGSDVESIAKRRTRGSFNGGSVGGGGVGGGQKKGRRSKRGLKKPAYDRPDDDAEPEPNQNQNRNRNENQNRTGGDGGDTQQPRKRRNNKDGKMRSFRNNYRKSGSGENAGSNSGRDARVRPIKPPRQLQDSVRIRVSNMFSVPFKQFKEELRKRDCYPAKISQSRNGRCQLIFPKREDTEEQVQVNELLQKLTDMHISVPDKNTNEPKQIWLRCDLQPKPGEFDENDVVFITSAANQAAKKATAACMKLATTTTSQTVTDPDANTKTNSTTTTTTTTSHLNLEELTAEVNAATLLAARAAKAAEVIAEKVLQEAKPAVEAESAKEDNKEHSAKLLAQVETLTKAGADALAASKKAEAAAVATTTNAAAADATKPANEAANAKDDSKEQTTAKVDADATGTKAETAATAESVAAKKEAIIAMSDAIQAAARATAAVSFAVATLYLLLPPATTRPHTVMVPSMRSLRFFGAILPKVVP